MLKITWIASVEESLSYYFRSRLSQKIEHGAKMASAHSLKLKISTWRYMSQRSVEITRI